MIYINDQIETFDLQAAVGQLSPQRRQQVEAFRPLLNKKLCAAAYLLLRDGLRKEFGVEDPPIFVFGEHGKPSIAGRPEIYFNMSHCREAAVCVVDRHPVGIDVESIESHDDALMRHVLNDAEYDMVKQSSSPNVAFAELWTRKESLLKLTGEGIRNDMKGVLSVPCNFETIVNLERGYVISLASSQLCSSGKVR